MTTKFTPGPWIRNGKAIYGWRIDSVSPEGLVGLEMLQNPVAIVPKKENADLIAAAPELFESLAALMVDLTCACDIQRRGTHLPTCPVPKAEKLLIEIIGGRA